MRSCFASLALLLFPAGAAAEPRPLRLDDVLALKDVEDPRLSPDGRWVAYTVGAPDARKDRANDDISMAPLDGGEPVTLTRGEKSESSPRFSPDGRWLAFLTDREGDKTQVWLLDRRGGEAFRLTDQKGGVSDLAWSPDGTRLALVATDPDPEEPSEKEKEDEDKPARPIVIRRLQFKRDGEGYLRELRKHIHVFDVARRVSTQVTSGPYDDSEPAWSPDGRSLAFTSNRTPEPDANENTDIFVVAATGGEPRRLTTWTGADSAPVFSPDGRRVAYLAGGDPKDLWYGTSHVAVVPVDGGPPTALSATLDRNVLEPRFSADGRWLYFRLEDAGNMHVARVPVAGGPVERVLAGERRVSGYDLGPHGELVVLESRPQQPPEVFAVDGTALRPLSRVNDEYLKGIRLGPVERFQARSADGTPIDGFLTRPPDAPGGQRLPAVLLIHGGPVDQYANEFDLEQQLLAAAGYAVIAPNPRGSSGRGTAFARAIWADWGNKDYADVMAAVDHVVAMGVADPDRLGVGGWSYGGILTDYVITRTGRFKAAVSGASEANYLANYGHDHYQYAWETELGLPWKETARWIRLSPWFQVEKVTTPTLVVCGTEDWNVPVINSEQLYQALRRLGKETELVVYPGRDHGRGGWPPSLRKDVYGRAIAWYDRYLKPAAARAAAGATPDEP